MKLLYADFNNFDEHGALPLSCRGSRESIAKLGEPLKDDEAVLLTDHELMVEARVRHVTQGGDTESWGDYWEAYGKFEYLGDNEVDVFRAILKLGLSDEQVRPCSAERSREIVASLAAAFDMDTVGWQKAMRAPHLTLRVAPGEGARELARYLPDEPRCLFLFFVDEATLRAFEIETRSLTALLTEASTSFRFEYSVAGLGSDWLVGEVPSEGVLIVAPPRAPRGGDIDDCP
jgi:hypothetical protein